MGTGIKITRYGLKEAVEAAEENMIEVADLINELGYTANDFHLILSRLILDELVSNEH